MKKLIFFLGLALIPIGIYAQKVSTYVTNGDTIPEVSDSFWITGAQIGATNATKAVRLNLLAPRANPEFTGTITVGDAAITEGELEVLDGLTVTTDEVNYSDGVTSDIQTQLDSKLAEADTVDLGTVVKILTDTSLYFAPVIGGEATDTVLFSYHDVLYGNKWHGSHTLNVTNINVIVKGTTPDIDINMYVDANMEDATPTQMLTADLTCTNTTVGVDGTVFTDATIAPDECWWIRVNECTAQPIRVYIAISGFLTE